MTAAAMVDFEPLLTELEADRELGEKLRKQSKKLNQSYLVVDAQLDKFRSTPSGSVDELLQQISPQFALLRSAIQALISLVPDNQYYKWRNKWSCTLEQIVCTVSFAYFLGTGRLVTKSQVCQVLNVKQEHSHRFQLSTEEYVQALVSLLNELSRLAVNSVASGDFDTPIRLSAFVKDVYAGFQVLNLKNDELQHRFSRMKIAVKKVEEVMYDISLRGLATAGLSEGVGTEVDEAKAEAVLRQLSETVV